MLCVGLCCWLSCFSKSVTVSRVDHIVFKSCKRIACGTWQFCLHNDEPCGFVTFLCISVATHVTARGVRVITMKRRIRFGSVRG